MKDQLLKVWGHPMRTPALAGAVAFGVGVGVGYILGKRKMSTSIAEIEVPEDAPVVVDMETIRNNMRRKAQEASDHPSFEKIELVTDDTPIATIMVNGAPVGEIMEEFDLHKEIVNRSSTEPYVLSMDEFMADEKGYTQTTLTYYAGDGIMVDEENNPVYNHHTIVGELKFGFGSNGQKDVFYVRNDQRRAEYEICREPGIYSEEVLGIDIEPNERVQSLKHSNDRVRRFKLE